MDNYRPFDQLRINELSVIRNGFWRPDYELTDGQFTYGTLTYQGFFRQTAILSVANKSWTIYRKSMWSRVLLIDKTQTGENIGEIKPELWSRKIQITMISGFVSFFTTKKILSRVFTMLAEIDGDIFTIDPKVWKFKTPFTISFNLGLLKTVPDMPLLILTGVYLALMRQQQAATAA